MSQADQDFIKAAHHAGFSIQQKNAEFLLFRRNGELPLARSYVLQDLGPTIANLVRAGVR